MRGNSFRGPRRGSQVVRQRSAKPLFAGSIPARASSYLPAVGVRRIGVFAALALLTTAEAGCDRGPKIGAPDHVAKVGNGQTSEVGTPVPTAPAVVVLDERDRGVPGVAVTFTVTTGAGLVQNSTVTTDKSGTASTGAWTLGNLAGLQSLRASATNVPGLPTSFTAVAKAGPAVTLTKVGNAPICSSAGASIDSLVVLATDKFGNPTPNQTVVFSVLAGGGTVSPATRTTLADGRAATRWTLGPDADIDHRASASRPDGSLPIFFTSFATKAVSGVRFADYVLVVDSAQSLMPPLVAFDASGATLPCASLLVATRNLNVATASATALVGIRSGQTFVVGSSADNPGVRDSAILVVAAAGKPAVTLTMPRFDLKADTTFTVSLIVDSRSASVAVGAATLQVVWNPAVVGLVGEQAGSANAFVDVNTSAAASGVATIAMASSNGLTGPTEIRRLTFKASAVAGRAGSISVNVIDMASAATFVNLVPQTVSGTYPLRIR